MTMKQCKLAIIITSLLAFNWPRLRIMSERQSDQPTYRHKLFEIFTPRCPVWCQLVTVPNIHSLNSQSQPAHSVSMGEVPSGNTQNGRTVLLLTDSESGSPVSYSSFLVTTCLSRLVSKIFTHDR